MKGIKTLIAIIAVICIIVIMAGCSGRLMSSRTQEKRDSSSALVKKPTITGLIDNTELQKIKTGA